MRWTTTRISITLWCSWIWTMSIVQGSLACAQQREPTLADFEEDLGAATHTKAHPAVTGCGMDQSRQDPEIYKSLESSLGNSAFNDFLDHWKSITSKVMVDIVRVDNFEISGIADQAIRDSLQGLLPSTRAIGIYKKQGVHATTVNVLIEHVASIYHSHE
ncbi:MAG: hypothetical protein J3Q66DRAFT_387408 [Benniella sp.]|nr:MAG: hypothetical protein J3Q66DRAFT_387408 [Benniella sp.]